MGKGKFNIDAFAQALGDVSNLSTSTAPTVQLIPLKRIHTNDKNFYQLRNLKPLADSIAMDGLQQPLLVTAHPEISGEYLLISGHRRRAAIASLVKDKENPREDLQQVPCMVREYKSPAMAELQLILANSTARVLTSSETMRQAEKMEMLLYQLKEEGYEFPGRMRDQVAAACKVSAPKLARLKVIREKLIPEYMALFEKDKLPEQTAYGLARLPADFQARLWKVVQDGIRGWVTDSLRERYEKGWRWEPDLSCPDGKTCRRGDIFLRHDAENPSWMCGGKTCCLECQRAKEAYCPCDRMCSKAKAVRKEKKDKEQAAADAKRDKNTRAYQRETQRNAQRLLLAIDAAGLSDNAKIEWNRYGATFSVKLIREYAAGQFPEGSVWYGAALVPTKLDEPATLAKKLGCTTDFLLGVSEELNPPKATLEQAEAVGEALPEVMTWRTDGDYPSPGWIVGVFDLGEQHIRQLIYVRGGKLWFSNRLNAPEMDMKPVRWIALPEED